MGGVEVESVLTMLEIGGAQARSSVDQQPKDQPTTNNSSLPAIARPQYSECTCHEGTAMPLTTRVAECAPGSVPIQRRNGTSEQPLRIRPQEVRSSVWDTSK